MKSVYTCLPEQYDVICTYAYWRVGFHRIPSRQRIYFSKSKANFYHFLYQKSMNNKYHTRYNLTLQVIWTFTCIILTITILSNPHITNRYRPPPLRMRSFAPFYSRPSSMKSLNLAKCRVRLARMWLLDNCWLPGDIPSTKIISVTSRVQILVVTKSISTFSKCQFLLGSCVT